MKPRPRSVEREVSELLSEIYLRHGYSPVKRIPTLGRIGPDIEINEAQFVIDAKSRIAVPQSHLLDKGVMGVFGEYVGVRIGELERESFKSQLVRPSLIVLSWLKHMDEWTREFMPNGISVVILHKPRTKIANATFVVKPEDWRKVCQIMHRSSPST